jgi:hypothetical protein
VLHRGIEHADTVGHELIVSREAALAAQIELQRLADALLGPPIARATRRVEDGKAEVVACDARVALNLIAQPPPTGSGERVDGRPDPSAFEELLELALDPVGWPGLERRQAVLAPRGKRSGLCLVVGDPWQRRRCARAADRYPVLDVQPALLDERDTSLPRPSQKRRERATTHAPADSARQTGDTRRARQDVRPGAPRAAADVSTAGAGRS